MYIIRAVHIINHYVKIKYAKTGIKTKMVELIYCSKYIDGL